MLARVASHLAPRTSRFAAPSRRHARGGNARVPVDRHAPRHASRLGTVASYHGRRLPWRSKRLPVRHATFSPFPPLPRQAHPYTGDTRQWMPDAPRLSPCTTPRQALRDKEWTSHFSTHLAIVLSLSHARILSLFALPCSPQCHSWSHRLSALSRRQRTVSKLEALSRCRHVLSRSLRRPTKPSSAPFQSLFD